ELGLNVALPVLPLHGPRKVTPLSGEPFLSFEMMNSVHGLAQSIWDVRRLVGWLRAQGATSIGLYGVSLGGCVVSLLAGLDLGFEAVIAGIPVVDLPTLFAAHSPAPIRWRADRHGVLGTGPEVAHHVVSPLAFEARIAHERRFIFAGYGDRMAFPNQAVRLWEHWNHPAICWYPGSHVGYLWSRLVARFLDRSLASAGLSERQLGPNDSGAGT
ncbi:MAG TPA: alpha/beta hydrolase, partial [Acidimicrobiales bacterium]|nr:alpha/beta hydrolase [Acidimicrobiales bacterium]